MALNIIKFLKGIRLLGNSSTVISAAGEMEYLSSSNKFNVHNGSSASPVVTEAHAATLTSKTLTTPIINEIVTSTDTNLNLNPNGTGKVVTDNLAFSGNTIESTDTNGDINITPDGTGEVVITNVNITGGSSLTIDNLRLDGNTLSSIDTDGNVNISPNGTGTVVVNTDLDVDNINVNGNTIISTNTDGDINITPNGTGSVVISDATIAAGTATLTSADITSITSAGGTLGNISVGVSDDNTIANGTSTITINGTGGTTVGTLLNVDNLRLDGNTLSTTNTDGNLTLTPNGTGTVVVSTDLDVDNVNVDGNTISSTNVDGDINLTANGTGSIIVTSSTGIISDLFSGGAFDGNSGRFGNVRINLDGDGVVTTGSGDLSITSATGSVDVTGVLNIDNISLDANTITTTDLNGDLTISPQGTGTVVITTDLDVDNINVNGNTISSTNSNGNIVLDPNGSGRVQTESALNLPEQGTPSTPSSGYGSIYFKSDGKLYQLNDAGLETEVGAAGGSGGINYIDNFDAETDTTGWSAYSTTAGNIPPAIPSGGTATGVTFSRSTSNPLRGVGSFSIVKDGNDRQGKGVSYPFNIDTADLAKPLSIYFDFNASSGFTASNGTTAPLNDGTTTTNAGNSDIEVFIWDNSNSRLIPVSPQVITAKGANNFTFTGSFQTDSVSQSYILAFHIATASTTSWTFKFDNVFVGPEFVSQGPVVTDWVSYTPTLTGFGTATNVEFQSRRVGDNQEIKGKFVLGTSTATEARISLPSGLTSASTSKIPTIQIVGKGNTFNISTTTNFGGLTALIEPSVTYLTIGAENSTQSGLTKRLGFELGSSGNTIALFASVPISGWSSNTVMSNDADTRVVAASATGSTQTMTGSMATVTGFTTVNYDTHGAYNTTTALYTCPVSGLYKVTSTLQTAVNTGTGSFRHQAVQAGSASVTKLLGGQAKSATNTIKITSGSAEFMCVAGDTLTVQALDADLNALGNGSFVQYERLSGPATIATTETVAAGYSASGVISWTATGGGNFDTKLYDSHSAVTTGANAWKFTAPVAGLYEVNATIQVSSSSQAWALFKNGSIYKYLFRSVSASSQISNGSTKVSLLAGDFIDLRLDGSTATGDSSSNANNIYVTRVGNYV